MLRQAISSTKWPMKTLGPVFFSQPDNSVLQRNKFQSYTRQHHIATFHGFNSDTKVMSFFYFLQNHMSDNFSPLMILWFSFLSQVLRCFFHLSFHVSSGYCYLRWNERERGFCYLDPYYLSFIDWGGEKRDFSSKNCCLPGARKPWHRLVLFSPLFAYVFSQSFLSLVEKEF